MPKKSILIIEDDQDISSLLLLHLSELGYDVHVANDGEVGLREALTKRYSLVILDGMLPRMDGNEVCRRIREKDSALPILFLTVRSDLMDKVIGLELGADDYLTKPFSIQELLARVKALIRRSDFGASGNEAEEEGSRSIEFPGLVIRPGKRVVVIRGDEVTLTPKQFDLLYFLARSPGRARSRAELLQRVWGYDSSGYEHTVDSHVNRLRSRVELDPAHPRYVLTVWGVGYRFAEPAELKGIVE